MELFFEVTNQKMERMDVEDPVNSSQEYLKLSFDLFINGSIFALK